MNIHKSDKSFTIYIFLLFIYHVSFDLIDSLVEIRNDKMGQVCWADPFDPPFGTDQAEVFGSVP
jgi:hypothetical protein